MSIHATCFYHATALRLTNAVRLLLLIGLWQAGSPANADAPTEQSSSAVSPALSAGMVGPGRSGGPPLRPTSWHQAGRILPSEEIGGYGALARGFFKMPGGLGMMYLSRPPGWPDGVEEGAANQVGGLAFSRNLVHWHDYPDNPVLYELAEWQGSNRTGPYELLYDAATERWIIYHGDSQGAYTGIRGVGLAYSYDLVNWHKPDSWLLSVDDFAAAVPHLMEATPEELISGGRVYITWAVQHEGRFYLCVSGSTRTGEGRTYERIILVGDTPDGPFEFIGMADDAMQADPNSSLAGTPRLESTPVLARDGRWYTVIRGSWDGQRGLGLAYADDLLGPYTENPHNPLFHVESTSRINPALVEYNGYWMITYLQYPIPGDTNVRAMYMAVSSIHPDILSFLE